ncbi:MAG: ATP-dependent Clp protease ATP-binding subunit [Clostridia bacterium]|nr:ATP-dependent Clp protease ATP-binding subunit [Clostridia bacterium]
MNLPLCTKCNKRPAVVFMTKYENGVTKNEGYCLLCAKELNIKQVDDMIKKMNISDEELEMMADQMAALEEELDMDDESGEGKIPALDIRSFLSGNGDFPIPSDLSEESGEQAGKKEKDPKKKNNGKKTLNSYCIDLTAKAREGKIDRIVGRDKELERVIQILSRRQKNNPCLIGEPGVGKTAIAEALAMRIVEGNVPYKLKSKEVFLLDLTSLIAGTQFRGMFENRMKALIEEIKKLGNIILVIDEVHTIAGSGDAEGGMNAANILKPALSRGEVQIIGATTLAEYRKYIEKDSALERRFQPVIVNEPSVDQTVDVLLGIKSYYEIFHGVKIPDYLLRKIVVLSERYITDRFLPDKAIDILDEACAHLTLSNPVFSRLSEVSDGINKIRAEKDSLDALSEKTNETYERLAELKVNELKLTEEFNALSHERDSIMLSEKEVAHVIEIQTGIPGSCITDDEISSVIDLDVKLKKRIIGQDEAVGSVCRAIRRSRTGISYKRKPVSFIFAGPTGVGKTELVKTLASSLFDSPESLIRLDMSEFMEKHSVSRIIGSPPGYVGYDDAGQLTEKIRRKPYSVILFDEIEKAHPDVMNILLQILDDGRISDAHGKEVNFENTVIIMTTNAGSSVSSNLSGFTATSAEIDSEKTKKALSEFLRPEFLNRVDEIITFNRLTTENFKAIADIHLGDLLCALEQRGISLTYTEDVRNYIAHNSFSEKYGARNLRRFIQTEIEDKIANIIIDAYPNHINTVNITCENGKLEIKAI